MRRAALAGAALGAFALAVGVGPILAADASADGRPIAEAAGAAPGRGTAMPVNASVSSLWITREQRAQRLLDAGRAAEAARLFRDPRRRAYAAMRAGHDAEAARILAPLRDPQSEYNRGNALARSGALLGALAAYDAALAQAPDDRDARHNRDLVARVLASRAQRGGASQSGQSGKQGDRGQSRSAAQRGSAGQGAPDARDGQSEGSKAGQAAATGGATPGQEAEQAREDAALAAALRRRGAQPGGSASTAQSGEQSGEQGGVARVGRGRAADDLPWPPPKSEQEIALEQWLRRIPEDPGGLLRRKFLIEHMERQEAEP